MKNFCLSCLIFILFTGVAFLVLAAENTEREWKSFSGKSVVTGTFEKFKPSNSEYIYIRSPNGKLYQYPFSKLSKEDQDFIMSLGDDDSDLMEVDETPEGKTARKKSGARGRGDSNSDSKENQGKKYALLVGINKYEDRGLEPLQYAVADIKLIYEKLKQIGFEPENIKMYISGNEVGSYPNKATVEAGFHEILEDADRDDQIFIAFAGHGFAFGEDSYFVVEDTKLSDDDKMKDTAININKILKELNDSKAASKWFIVDACREYITKNRSIGKNYSRGISSGLEETKLPDGVFFLQSCSKGEFSYEDDGHGLFTRCFVDALDGKADVNKDGDLMVMEVFNYVSDTVKKDARNILGKRQTPTFRILDSPNFCIVSTSNLLQHGIPITDWDKIQKLYDDGSSLLNHDKRPEALEKLDLAIEMMEKADDDAPMKVKIKGLVKRVREGMERDKKLEEFQKAQNDEKEKQLEAEKMALLKRLEESEIRAKAAEDLAQKAAEEAAQKAAQKAAEEVLKKKQEQEKPTRTTVVTERPTYHAPTQFVYLGKVRSVQGDNSQARQLAAQYGYRLPSPEELSRIQRRDISGLPGTDGWIETSNPYVVCDIFFQQLRPVQKRGTGQNIVVGCR